MKSSKELRRLHESIQPKPWPGFGPKDEISFDLWVSVAEQIVAALPEIIGVVEAAEDVATNGHDAFQAQRIVELAVLRLDDVLR